MAHSDRGYIVSSYDLFYTYMSDIPPRRRSINGRVPDTILLTNSVCSLRCLHHSIRLYARRVPKWGQDTPLTWEIYGITHQYHVTCSCQGILGVKIEQFNNNFNYGKKEHTHCSGAESTSLH